MKKLFIVFFLSIVVVIITMTSIASSNYFKSTFKNTYIDKCGNETYLEEGDNLSTPNKIILYIYRYGIFDEECKVLQYKNDIILI